ncbi:DUF4382 domain-containing protein, partial [Burkholderia pseudomallei]
MITILKFFGLASAVSLLLSGCGGGGDNSGHTGTLHVAMTDATSCGFDHIYVTVAKVRVNMSAQAGDNDSGGTDVALAAPQ